MKSKQLKQFHIEVYASNGNTNLLRKIILIRLWSGPTKHF